MKVIKFILKLIIFLITVEVVLRLSFVIFPNIGIIKILKYNINIDKYINVYDSYLGFKQLPNIDFTYKHPEFTFNVKTISIINNENVGFRDDCILDQNIFALCIGDSFCWGTGVEKDWIWNEILEKKLGREIINMGLPGCQPQTYTRLVEKYVPLLKPKYVFYCVNALDRIDAIIFDKWENGGFFRYINTSKDISGGRLTGIRKYFKKLFHTYLIYSYFKEVYFPYTKGTKLKKIENISLIEPESMSYVFNLNDPEVVKGTKLLFDTVLRARDICNINGAKFIFVIIPHKEEIYLNQMSKAFNKDEEDLDQSINNFIEFCEKNKIMYVDLSKVLRSEAKKGKYPYFKHDGHWNNEGNQIVAEYMYKLLNEICDLF